MTSKRLQQTTGKTDSKSSPPQKSQSPTTQSNPNQIRVPTSPDSLNAGEVLRMQQTVGNRAVQRLLSNHTVQAKLTVGPVGDTYEQEADRVADQIMSAAPAQANRSPQNTSPGQVQAKPLAESISPLVQRETPTSGSGEAGFAADGQLEGRLAAQQHGGQPLPAQVRADLEPKFGADFSQVRVHTSKDSVQLNRDLSARAFTYGNHIHFNAGQYNPTRPTGKKLLAHELTHVVQQQSNALQRKYIQRATVNTMGGTWTTKKYEPVMVDDVKPGGEIIIEFTPNNLVDSKKIGLLQKIEKVHNGKNLDAALIQQKARGEYMGNATKTAAGRTTGRGHWDRALDKSNPVYGAPDLNVGQGIEKTPLGKFDVSETTAPDKRSNYQLGYNYKSFLGLKSNKRPAMLHDKPNMPSAKEGSAMIFETAAMSLEGAQKNVYYGSVKWGWKMDAVADDKGGPAVGDIDLVPFEVVSAGTPSAEMKGLADVWNQADTTTAKGSMRNTQVPTVGHDTRLTPDQMTDKGQVQTAIKDLEAALKLPTTGNDKKNMQFELKALKEKLRTL